MESIFQSQLPAQSWCEGFNHVYFVNINNISRRIFANSCIYQQSITLHLSWILKSSSQSKVDLPAPALHRASGIENLYKRCKNKCTNNKIICCFRPSKNVINLTVLSIYLVLPWLSPRTGNFNKINELAVAHYRQDFPLNNNHKSPLLLLTRLIVQ